MSCGNFHVFIIEKTARRQGHELKFRLGDGLFIIFLFVQQRDSEKTTL